jgi:rhodanese-related sulfurtransferase
MRLLFQMASIALGGSVLGLILNAASCHPVSLTRAVYPSSASGITACGSAPEAQHQIHGHRVMLREEAVDACRACSAGFVDARGAAAFAEGHIPGALHLPPAGHPDESDQLEKLRAFPVVVVYDSGGGCGLAEGVVDRLSKAGFKDVRLLAGSWTDWTAAGGPAQSGICAACGAHGEASP